MIQSPIRRLTRLGCALVLATAFASSAALIGTPTASAQEAAPTRVGMVDLQRALNTVREGRQARTRLEADFASRREGLARQQQELETFAQELEASLPMLTQEAAMERYQEYQQRVLRLQEAAAGEERALAEAEATATEAIFERMMVVAGEIARERGYTLVVERSTVVYIAEGSDFTDELITRYDARH
jgi:outer membrane protein